MGRLTKIFGEDERIERGYMWPCPHIVEIAVLYSHYEIPQPAFTRRHEVNNTHVCLLQLTAILHPFWYQLVTRDAYEQEQPLQRKYCIKGSAFCWLRFVCG